MRTVQFIQNVELIQNEIIFDNFLNVFYDGIYISDNKGKTIKINKKYEKITGLKKDEVVGRNVLDLVNDGTFDIVLNPLVVKTGSSQHSLQSIKTGKKVFLNGYPVIDKNKKVVYVITLARDIATISQIKEEINYQEEAIKVGYQDIKQYDQSTQTKIVIENPKMKQLMTYLKKIAATDATVLIMGETGVGKDVFASQIHEQSSRANEPFLKINCASIPENLIESELFGYESGAFSGANIKGKPGYFELADNGTLFLDEIGELPLALQAKLLQVLEEKKIMRLGGTKIKKLNVRIIAATNRNLEEAVKEKKFRSDLYYRLRVAVLEIPPLRDRKEDILPLIMYFLYKYNFKYEKKLTFSTYALEILKNYSWPGNVREMENLIQSIVIDQDKQVIEASDLPLYINNSYKNNIIDIESEINSEMFNIENTSLKDIMAKFEKQILEQAIAQYGSISIAAKNLKIDRSTIFRKLKKYF